jgi:hypothetical protein
MWGDKEHTQGFKVFYNAPNRIIYVDNLWQAFGGTSKSHVSQFQMEFSIKMKKI